MSDPLSSLAELRLSPSYEAWMRVLDRLVLGQFDDYLLRLAPEEFIQMNIAESSDQARSRSEFLFAFGHFVHTWSPEQKRKAAHLEIILRLISAFTPAGGFSKLLLQLTRHGNFFLKDDNPDAATRVLDIALAALENYFPTPLIPEENADDPFRYYKTYLLSHVSDPRVGPHCCARLIEFKRFEL